MAINTGSTGTKAAAAVANVDDYIAALPNDVRPVVEALRQSIHRVTPGFAEGIRYDMPTISLNGRYIVHFAAWKKHIGMYPVPLLDEPLESDVAPYRSTKNTIRLPLNKPLPYELIERVVAALVDARS